MATIYWPGVVLLGLIMGSFLTHEYGHYIAARLLGAKVFGILIGFPKPMSDAEFFERYGDKSLILEFTHVSLTHFSLGIVLPDDFYKNTPRWKVTLVYLAGPAVNIVLAWAAWTFLWSYQYGYWMFLINLAVGITMLMPFFKKSDGWQIWRQMTK